MRRLAAVCFTVLVAGVPVFAAAQSLPVFTPTGSTVNLLQPLPPPMCPPSAFGYSLCDSIKAAVQTYNTQVMALNEIQEIRQRQQQYLQYPQRLQSYVQADLNTIQSIRGQTQQALQYDTQVQQRINSQFQPAQGVPAAQAASVYQSLASAEASYRDEIIRGLGVSDASASASQRDNAASDAVQSAGQAVTNPTQAAQLLVQQSGLLYNALQRVQSVQAEQLRFDVTQASYDRATRASVSNVNAQLKAQNMTVFDPSLPTPAPSGSP